jgi:hypothetical protein
MTNPLSLLSARENVIVPDSPASNAAAAVYIVELDAKFSRTVDVLDELNTIDIITSVY